MRFNPDNKKRDNEEQEGESMTDEQFMMIMEVLERIYRCLERIEGW